MAQGRPIALVVEKQQQSYYTRGYLLASSTLLIAMVHVGHAMRWTDVLLTTMPAGALWTLQAFALAPSNTCILGRP